MSIILKCCMKHHAMLWKVSACTNVSTLTQLLTQCKLFYVMTSTHYRFNTSKVPSSRWSSAHLRQCLSGECLQVLSLLVVTSTSQHTVSTCIVPMGNCAYEWHPPTILYLQAKVQLQTYCTSWDIAWRKTLLSNHPPTQPTSHPSN